MAVATIPSYIPLKEAAQRLRVSIKVARVMLKSGKIQGGVLPDGEMIVIADSVPEEKKIKKEDLPEYKKFAHLKGIGIWLSEAGRRYNIPQPTISHWVRSGIVKKIQSDGYRVYVDEQDIAYCSDVYHQRRGQGKWLFDDNGAPYKLKTGAQLTGQ